MHRGLDEIQEARLDCEDAEILYVKGSRGKWIKAFHSKFQSLIDEDSRIERTFDRCWDSIDSKAIRRERASAANKLRKRLDKVNKSALAGDAHPLKDRSARSGTRDDAANYRCEELPSRGETEPFDEVDG
ncbi:hypothetical protein D3C81_1126610 [compost metagenome]